MDISNTVENIKRRLIDDYIDVLNEKIHNLNNLIWEEEEQDALFDQYPGKCVPFCYTRMFGPIDMTNDVGVGKFVLPRRDQGNINIGREGDFHWIESNYVVYRQKRSVAQNKFGDITDPVFGDHLKGGADRVRLVNGNNYDSTGNQDYFSFDIQFYDKKRGRSIHEGIMPFEFIMGGADKSFINKRNSDNLIFKSGTELEIRLFPNGPFGADFDVLRYFVIIMLKGYLSIDSYDYKFANI